jgi:hypothetical protein
MVKKQLTNRRKRIIFFLSRGKNSLLKSSNVGKDLTVKYKMLETEMKMHQWSKGKHEIDRFRIATGSKLVPDKWNKKLMKFIHMYHLYNGTEIVYSTRYLKHMKKYIEENVIFDKLDYGD